AATSRAARLPMRATMTPGSVAVLARARYGDYRKHCLRCAQTYSGPGGTMRGPRTTGTSGARGSSARHWLVLAALVCATVALPLNVGSASAQSGKSSASVVKVGMLAPISSLTAANPDQGEAFKAAVAAFNKRGGLGKSGARMEAVVCDT